MLNERRRTVLAALVDEYIASVQPVGSKVLVERYHLGCSPATGRSELAVLEETGLVYQPHVSAGRIPTETGYRVYVDDVVAPSASGLGGAEAEAVWRRCSEAEREPGEVLREISALLSRLTSYVAVVAAPTIRRARIRRVTLVALGARRVLVVLVTDTGQVADRVIEFDTDVTPAELARVEEQVSRSLDGALAEQVALARASFDEDTGGRSGLLGRVLDEVADCLKEADHDRLVTGGVSALFGHPELADPGVVRPLIGLLENSLEMLRAISDLMRSPDVEVRIGHENPVGALEHASVVAARYGSGGAEGVVGVIGPTRMDYRRAISAVRTVSEALTEAIGS
jgi:heat-inducible transcriptional repressor